MPSACRARACALRASTLGLRYAHLSELAMAGIDARGRLLLVTVDGRQPGVSEGVTLVEGARLMRSLGAVDALNLDGGGSSAMVVAGAVVNKPSDAAGERAVGDVVAVLP